LELWGGVEPTINRVHDEYIKQLPRSGHLDRLSDFDRFAELGVKALRHPVLWEQIAPQGLDNADWRWADSSLNRIRELNIRPIAGLIHHGSGPKGTSLLDPEFPHKLAAYAGAVARRYPWLEDYTPVNEPLTTARFSCLYGHWYPHSRDDHSFARALLNQCKAVVLSMRAIREVNPDARLIQTDDLGTIHSTPKLAYQAEFENERRWCAYDLLCGRVDRNQHMLAYFHRAGVETSDIDWFQENSCPPDVIGINHYLSSDRYLDEHITRYPGHLPGGNGRDRYVDVLAARVLRDRVPDILGILLEAWKRYQLPIAITECHNGCTREEQLRWFVEMWSAAEQCRRQGVDVIALTAWSLLGAFDWNNLVTRNDGHYEPGVFDVRSAPPRATALVEVISDMASRGYTENPLVSAPGWWRRSQRFSYGFTLSASGERCPVPGPALDPKPENVKPLIITGGRGTLAQAFVRICEMRGIPYRLTKRDQFDIADPVSVRRLLFEVRPWAILNAAGYVRVDDAELDPGRCFRENAIGAGLLASECAARGISLLTFSSDLVFNGKQTHPYLESDAPAPLNQYGASKAEGERRVLEAMPGALVVRSSAFFGPWDEYNFLNIALRTLAAGQEFRCAYDATVSPTYVPDLVHASLDLLIDGERGMWHLANPGETTWAEFAANAATAAGVPLKSLRPCTLQELGLPAERPQYSVLGSERAVLLPPLTDALARFMGEIDVDRYLDPLAA